ncbi:uncharacterized protein J7T54_003177 [Emericellopsis cladophorae]|uniref:FAD-binding FR-type domain-containing protein n=1 Tax=Emericellopsis cladophorae TaxID=2686198 RepID=A0A9Q0B8F4_9HYPO|nr:uncharacterized protein J7T54_003177 [Emericellopsis cladophorae]KAI6777932.1 hypothetical protein J7T54_003177 [Emericellopsis cladophorae]
MGWPYRFVTLSDEEKALRRKALDTYAAKSHLSLFLPPLLFLIIRLVLLVIDRVQRKQQAQQGGRYQSVPGSPIAKAHRLGNWGLLRERVVKIGWWLEDDIFRGDESWGQRGEWILGLGWLAWLLTLCVLDTGHDFLHLTKRFGLVACAQLPGHYLLSLKSPVNPVALVFRTSHERYNRYHRVLGRVLYVLLALHVAFYNYYLWTSGIWLKRMLAPVVFAGVVASMGLHVLSVTSMTAVRRYSYRLFFITHLVTALSLPTLIFFHAPSARVYLVEALVIFICDLAARKLYTTPATSKLEKIPGTDLVKIVATVPHNKMAKFQARPGSHVYINLPAASRPSQKALSPNSLLYEFIFNPFTVASVQEDAGTLTLVARSRDGPLTRYLSTLSSLDINIEGPHGAAGKYLHRTLSGQYDRILLLAGGVGATFTVPVYRAILKDNPSAKVSMVWAIRSAADATWAPEVLTDDNVQLFLTGDMGLAPGSERSVAAESIEMSGRNRKRPDVGRIVDETFSKGREESVAVLVCGPKSMSKEARQSVGAWVMKGRKVWWHDEAFGW